MIGLLGLVWTQIRTHPRRHTERLCAVLIAHAGQFQMGAGLHPHVGPKPRALSPNYRGACSCREFAPFAVRRVSERVGLPFIETQTDFKTFGAYRSRLSLRTSPHRPHDRPALEPSELAANRYDRR